MNIRKSSIPALAIGIAFAVSSPSAPAEPTVEPIVTVHVEIGEAASIERELTEIVTSATLPDLQATR